MTTRFYSKASGLVALLMLCLASISSAQDYTITTTGGNLIITDVSGNGETLTMVQDGANIRFGAPTTRTYSLDGAAAVAFPVDGVSVAGGNPITINAGGGNDVINIGSSLGIGTFTDLPSLTINGGTGNDEVAFNVDITFLPNASLNVDLQDDDATPGVDNIRFAANTDLVLSGTGAALMRASRDVWMGASRLETANGDITIEANQQTTPTAGDFAGVFIANSRVQALGTGIVTIRGKGGDSGIGGKIGVSVTSGSIVSGGTIGTSTIVIGTGGTSTNNDNYGVYIANINSQITSAGGNVSVTGTGIGGLSSFFNAGVVVAQAGRITAGGSGTVTVTGQGSNLSVANNARNGVWVRDSGSQITSSGGNVTVNGTGGSSGSAANNRGVLVGNEGLITAGGTGTVTVTGQGGGTTGLNNHGVYVSGPNAQITSSGGNVSITGTGGGASASLANHGVGVDGGGIISVGGSGTLTITGQGGNTTGADNEGVVIRALVTSSGGNISVTGTGGGGSFSDGNVGVRVSDAVGEIRAGGTGTVTVIGTGGNASGINNDGVDIFSDAKITSNNGNVLIRGIAGGLATSSNGVGIFMEAGSVSAGGSGTLTIEGRGGTSTGAGNIGILMNAGAAASSSGGNITMTGTEGGGAGGTGIVIAAAATGVSAPTGSNILVQTNSIALNGTITAQPAHSVTIRPRTAGVAVNLGATTDPIAGPLSLSEAELNRITAGTLIIGDDNTGNITVSANITRTTAINTQLISGGDIITGGNLNVGGTLLLNPGATTTRAIRPEQAGTDFTASTATLTSSEDLLIRINGTTADTQYDRLNIAGNVNLNGAVLRLAGTPIPALTGGEVFTIVNSTGTRSGTFNGLAENAIITGFLSSGFNARINYTANTVTLTVVAAPVADYTITTTGGNLIITDVSGNGETLTMAQDGANIRFTNNVFTRTYSINGGAITAFTTPADVAVAGITNSITINAGGGNDIINIGAFTAALPSLTINGGLGNDQVNMNGDITFAANANLDIDLQNDDATPGLDGAAFTANTNVILSGTGAATIKVSRNVTFASGSSLEAVNGNITIETNQQTTSTTFFQGVQLFAATIRATGTGVVTVRGRGADFIGAGSLYGVGLLNGSIISGGTTGNSTIIEGQGGFATLPNNYGVVLLDGSQITSSGGNVSVTGTGGGVGAAATHHGVFINTGSQITAGVNGTVTVIGQGGIGASGNANHGVFVTGTDSRITSNNGNVSVTGTGGGTGASADNRGVQVASAGTITAGGTGNTVTVIGQGGASTGSFNHGVWVVDTNSRITSSGGNVRVEGTGGGAVTSADNRGVQVESAGTITAGVNGTVTVIGQGGTNTGGFNHGVRVVGANSRIASSGGNVSVTGTGGGTGTSDSNRGVQVESAAEITAGVNGTVTVIGQGGLNGSGGFNHGVYIANTSSRITSSGGNVRVEGTGGGTGTSADNRGVHIESAGIITAGGASSTVTVIGQGGTGTGNDNYGVLVTDGSSSITSSGGNVRVEGTGGGSGSSAINHGVRVIVGGAITAGGNGTVTVNGTGGVNNGNLNEGIWVLAATITSNNGNVLLRGFGGGSSNGRGVLIDQDGTVSAGGTGTVTIEGTGSSGAGGNNFGIWLFRANARVTSSGGNITLIGTEGNGSSGIRVENTSAGIIAPTGSNVLIQTNSLVLDQTITAQAAHSVSIRPLTAGVAINLGATTDPIAGPLSLSEAELNRITAGTLIIGDNAAGDITVSANITRTTAINTQLISGGDIITAGNLNVGGTLLLNPGATTTRAVRPQQAGTDFTASTATLNSGEDLLIRINGTTVDTQYDQLNVAGNVNLNGAVLRLTGTHTPVAAQVFTIVNATGTLSGTFNGLADNAIISNFLGSGLAARINYTTNAVTLTVITPDYTITTTGGNLIITDVSGNGETLTMAQNGTNIRFTNSNTARTYSINGGAVTAFTTPADVAVASITNSITINAAAGNDVISIGGFMGAFAANFPSLTVNGGTGNDEVFMTDDITFAANANLDIDLQNDDATPGIDKVDFLANANIVLSGTGQALIIASQSVGFTNGSSLQTANGNLTIEANQQATPTLGDFAGVLVFNATVEVTGTGILTVKGKGGNGGPFQAGVWITAAAVIRGGTTGNSTIIEGIGGESLDANNIGVYVTNANSRITSSGGNVSVSGTGGGDDIASSANYGVSVQNAAAITAGGSGTVTVTGQGGVSARNSGNIGVHLSRSNAQITSSGGNVSVTGTGGGAGPASFNNHGVLIDDTATITASGSGTVTVQGQGSLNAIRDSNIGVTVATVNGINSSGGNVTVNGTGGGTGPLSNNNFGVSLSNAGTITAGGSGTVTISGTGSPSVGINNHGIRIADTNSAITSSGGNIVITGVGGTNSGAGLLNNTANGINTSGGGDIIINANSIQLDETITAGTNTLTIRPRTAGVAVNLGAATDPIAGPLSLSETELNRITAGTLIIGDNAAGDITVSANITRTTAINAQLVSGGDIITGGNLNVGGTLLLNPGATTTRATRPQQAGTDFTASTATLNSGEDLLIRINGTTVDTQYDQLNVAGNVNLNGAVLRFTGSTHTPATGDVFTIVNATGTRSGTFNGLADNTIVNNFLGSSLSARINYTATTVTLTVIASTPDYTITTTGGNLIITDVSGNGETLTMAQDGTNIRFTNSNATRTYAINGGAVTAFATPADIALAGITNSITINAAAGNDVINIGTFTANLPSLTINGGTGDDEVNMNGDITFAANANLDIDLQNDDATPGTDRVTFAANANIILSGTGAAVIRVSRDVLFSTGSSLEAVNGNITIEANLQAAATAGNFQGVRVGGATVQVTGTGMLSIRGKGGNSGGAQTGVVVDAAGVIRGGTNTMIVAGIGGASTNSFNYGVYVSDANSRITSSGGNVIVNGTGGGAGTSSSNTGVGVSNTGEIAAGGSGTVTIIGQGSTLTDGNLSIGVLVSNTSRITSSGGNVTVNGTGGGAGASVRNYGVYLATSTITAGGSGTVTVIGQGGTTTGSDNYGIYVLGTDSQITSSGGNVTVNGTGGGTGASAANYGVLVSSAGTITAGGSGTVTVTGQGGASTGSQNDGVHIVNNAQITSAGGNVVVTGTGGTGSGTNMGVVILNAGRITSNGTGTVTVIGQGGDGNDSVGVYLQDAASQITSSNGDVTVTGVGGGTGMSTRCDGVVVRLGSEITAGGITNTVTVNGTGGSGLGANNMGITVEEANSRITSSGGNIVINGTGGTNSGVGLLNSTANGINTSGGGNITINANSVQLDETITAGTNTLTIRPRTAGVAIDLGAATDPIAGPLGVSEAELNRITAGTLIIGDNTAGDITVSANITRTTAINTQLISGGDIITGGNLNVGGTLLLNPGATTTRAIRPQQAGTDFTASTATLNSGEDLRIRINGTTVDTQYDQLNVTGNINLNDAVLRLTGGHIPATGQVFTIVNATGAVSGTFNGLANNAIINRFLGGLRQARINYTANTVTLTVLPPPPPVPAPPSGLDLSSLPVLTDRVFNPAGEIINPVMRLQNGQTATASVAGPVERIFERGVPLGYRITGAGRICFTFFGEPGTGSRAEVCLNVTPALCGAITFAALADVAWNTSGQTLVASSACSGVNFRIVSGPADIAEGLVRPLPRQAGTVTVEAAANTASLDVNRDGVADFTTPAPVQRSFRVLPIAQTITFNTSIIRADVGFRIPLSAFASSGLPVTLTVVSGNGRIEGTFVVITGAGEIVIEATQGGNEAWLPATPVRRTVEGVAPVRVLLPQEITFNLPASGSLQNGFALSATATSNLPVSFALVEGGAFARIEGGNLVITARPTTVTTITIEATQGGNEVFAPALPVRRSFRLLPQGTQTTLLSTGTLCQGSSIRAQIAGNFGTDVSLRLVVSDNQGNFNGSEGFLDARPENANTLISYQTHSLLTGTYRVRIDVVTADGVIVGIPSTANFQLVAVTQLLGIEEGISATGARTLRSPIATGNSWTRDGVAAGNGQSIEATQPGWYQLTVQAGNCTFIAKTYVSNNGRTEATDAAAEARTGFKVYPNPGKGVFTLQGRQSVDGEAEVVISDMQGRIISRQSISGRQMNETIDLQQVSTGVYLLQIRQADGKVWTEKLVKE